MLEEFNDSIVFYWDIHDLEINNVGLFQKLVDGSERQIGISSVIHMALYPSKKGYNFLSLKMKTTKKFVPLKSTEQVSCKDI